MPPDYHAASELLGRGLNVDWNKPRRALQPALVASRLGLLVCDGHELDNGFRTI